MEHKTQIKIVKKEPLKYQFSKIHSNHGRWILRFGLEHIESYDKDILFDKWTNWEHYFYFHYKKDMHEFIENRLKALVKEAIELLEKEGYGISEVKT